MTNTTAAARAAARRAKSDVSTWAADLPPEWLLCRDLGHLWQPWQAWHDKAAREYTQVLRCGRCEVERVRSLDYRGQRTGGHYNYPDGYLAPAGSGFLSQDGRADIRLLSFLRLLDEDDEVGARRQRKAS